MPGNKIKLTQQQLYSQDHSFQLLLSRLKEDRPQRYDLNASEPPFSQHDNNPPSRDLISEGPQSTYINPVVLKRAAQTQADPVLRNPHRVGHAGRYRVKQFQLPAHYFTPTKQQLQQHLQHSRVLSNSISPIPSTVRQNCLKEMELTSLQQSRALKDTKNHTKLQDVDSDLILKYCLANYLTPSSQVDEIFLYFSRLLELAKFSLPSPKIEKYRDCIYFGTGKETSQQGLLYFFNNYLYLGQLKNHRMHGYGRQIFFNPPLTYKGQFNNGQMVGRNIFQRSNVFESSESFQKRSNSTQNEWNRSKVMPISHRQNHQDDVYKEPRSKNGRVNRVDRRIDASDVLEFSYPFGQELPELPSRIYKSYRSRGKASRSTNYQYQSEYHNPEHYQNDFPKQEKSKQRPKMAQWSTNYPERVRQPTHHDHSAYPRMKAVGHLTQRPDSSDGQEAPLRSKC